MGPSGCGKSSLLNTLAMRLDSAVEMHGSLRLNGREYNRRLLKQCSGYVMQDDLLNGRMTVEETLGYTAQLKLPKGTTPEMRAKRVDQVCKQMGLVHIRGVIVGDSLLKGISGGERKRLCVAMELLTRPALLFLDEPTSGRVLSSSLLSLSSSSRISPSRASFCPFPLTAPPLPSPPLLLLPFPQARLRHLPLPRPQPQAPLRRRPLHHRVHHPPAAGQDLPPV